MSTIVSIKSEMDLLEMCRLMLAATETQTSKMRRNLLVVGGQRGRFKLYMSVISTRWIYKRLQNAQKVKSCKYTTYQLQCPRS